MLPSPGSVGVLWFLALSSRCASGTNGPGVATLVPVGKLNEAELAARTTEGSARALALLPGVLASLRPAGTGAQQRQAQQQSASRPGG